MGSAYPRLNYLGLVQMRDDPTRRRMLAGMGITDRGHTARQVDVTRVSSEQFKRMMEAPARPSDKLRNVIRERQEVRRAS